MSDRKSGIRAFLSRLKSRIVSRDLQDIYQFQPAPGDVLECDKEFRSDTSATYRVYDNVEVLEMVERVQPLDDKQRRFARARLASGDKAVIGTHDDTPVFYGWLMFDEIEMTYGIFLPVPAGIAFGYNLLTKSTYRRRGAMTGFYSFVCEYLKQQNIHRLNVGIATDNTASIKAHEKNGFVKIGYFYTIRLLGIGFTLARFEHAKRFYCSLGQPS